MTQPISHFLGAATRSAALTLTLILVSATVAFAAAPANDNRADATVIESLPYSDNVDIAEATTEVGEPQRCSNHRSVWYRYTATADEKLVATARAADFTPSITVYRGTLEAMSFFHCSSASTDGEETAVAVAFNVVPDQTYFFQVAGFGDGETAPVEFALRPQVDVETAPANTLWGARDGSVTVTGRVSCSSPVSAQLKIGLDQRVDGETWNQARGQVVVSCDTKTLWQLKLQPLRRPEFTSKGVLRMTVLTVVPSEDMSFRRNVELELVRCTRIGTVGDDTMRGTSGKDRLCAMQGDDVITGGAGDDVVYGYDGSDTIGAGRGTDTVSAGRGADVVELGNGNDVVKGGDGRDRIFGEGGSDRLSGNGGPDVLAGGTGSDTCTGGPGRDSFRSCETKR